MYGQEHRWMYNPMHPGFHPIFGLFFLVILAVILGIAVLYILTLRRALELCAPQNRAADPDSAWLLIIPIFHLFWQFILYPRISISLEREFRQRGLPVEPNPAYTLGITLAILNACSLIPLVNIFTGIAGFICFILYWIKISAYSSRLEASSPAVLPPGWSQQPQAQPHSAQPHSTWPAAPVQPQAQAATRFCTTCGKALQAGERFCANCGSPGP